MFVMKRLLLIISLTLGACQTTPPQDANSPRFAPPVGWTLQLNQSLTVPARASRIYFQGGKSYAAPGVISFSAVDQYYPNCYLQMRSPVAEPRQLQPDIFRIERVRRTEDWVQSRPLEVAMAGMFRISGTGMQIYSTVLDLHSDRQPDVWRLSCQQWDEPYDANHVTVNQIRKALGDIFTLGPAAQGS
jgi:hypothetical protein